MILIGTFVLFILAAWALGTWLDEPNSYGPSLVPFVLGVIGIMGLVMCLVTIPTSRMETRAFAYELSALQQHADLSRKEAHPLEGAAWRGLVAEKNARLARIQYWNKTLFDLWHPDDVVNQLKPIQ